MQALEPPEESSFATLLHWHLFEYGTRPGDRRNLWDRAELVDALIAARQVRPTHRRYRSEAASSDDEITVRRSLNGWLSGQHTCADRPWGILLEGVLFGELGSNGKLDQWRAQFREARNAPQHEGNRSGLYTRDPLPEPTRTRMIEKVGAGLHQEGWELDVMQKGQGVTHPAFNRELVIKQPKIRLRCLQESWDALDRYHEDLLRFVLADKRGDARNDKKIRVASDFIGRSSVDIQETNYFSSLMTDQLAWERVRSNALQKDGMTPELILWPGTAAFIGKDGKLKRLGEASISNQLSASTLAFTTDGHLMIVYQNRHNRQSAHMLAPSGSGSLDWADITDCKASDLLTLVQYGAKRELDEECALDDDGGQRPRIGSSVMVTGFVRMLHRAGKPEFYCLGWIDAPAHVVRDRRPERYVERVLDTATYANWDIDRPRDGIRKVCRSYLDTVSQSGVHIPLSFPLEHSLRLLVAACDDSEVASVVDNFVLRNANRHKPAAQHSGNR
jgi:hypothetical protein